MGERQVADLFSPEELRRFTKKLLVDLRALELMLGEGMIESGRTRIGAEQELFLVDEQWRPAPVATEVLAVLNDPHFVPELGRFNLEFNVDPLEVGPDGHALRRLEAELERMLAQVRQAARQCGAEVILTGILPTLDKADLTLDNMTPRPRYRALNDVLMRLRGEEYLFRIKGRDELLLRHDNIMLEACNTSFQIHFQVSPEEFARAYNIAQAVAGPTLSAAANSPLLFGRHLWRETRIALFQQSVDTRVASSAGLREQTPRVSFGGGWVRESVLEIFQEDIARFPVLFGSEVEEDPFDEVRQGRVPQLAALRVHNGTVYRWNRPCCGISEGRPHLRIENRILPAGPSVIDEVANAAFWFGLIRGFEARYGDVTRILPFETARENFTAAARLGVAAHLEWPGRGLVAARDLIREDLLPVARHGLAELGIVREDIDRYLGVIEGRVGRPRTGAMWLLDSLAGMKPEGSKSERLAALVAATHDRQQTGAPVHTWELARLEEAGRWRNHYLRVGQLMTTDLFTVRETDLVDLLAYVMHWKHIRHVPVEDADHRLVGLVTHRALLRLIGESLSGEATHSLPVSSVMHREVLTVRPETPTREAFRMMKAHKVSGLPVVTGDHRLVGMITEHDLMGLAGKLLENFLAEPVETAGESAAEPD